MRPLQLSLEFDLLNFLCFDEFLEMRVQKKKDLSIKKKRRQNKMNCNCRANEQVNVYLSGLVALLLESLQCFQLVSRLLGSVMA